MAMRTASSLSVAFIVLLGTLAGLSLIAPHAAAVATGGPDSAGYRWIDSTTAGGPTYSWTAITGTEIAYSGFDGTSAAIALNGGSGAAFDFKFYGASYSSVYVQENGYIGFVAASMGSGAATYTPVAIPNTAAPNYFIAGLMVDNAIGTCTTSTPKPTVRYQVTGTAPDRTFILQYTDVTIFGCGSVGPLNWQLHLSESRDDATVYFKDATYSGASDRGTLVGIERDGTALFGLEYFRSASGGAVALSGKAVRFYNNQPPVATDDTATTNEDTAITIDALSNDSDPDSGDTLSITAATDPPKGTTSVSGTPTKITYTPDANSCGSDSFDYTLSDTKATDTGTVSVTVTCVNDDPTLAAITDRTLTEDAAATNVALTGIDQGGGSDEDVQTLIVTAASSNLVLLPNPAVTYTSGSTGSLSLTPNANEVGTSTVTVRVTDSLGAFTTRAFLVTVTAVNDVPTITTIVDQTLNEDATKDVTIAGLGPGGGSDEASQTLTVTATSDDTALLPNPVVTYTSGATGSLRLQPVADKSGTAHVTVKILDSAGAFSTTTFTTTVAPVNDAPTARNDAFTVDEDSAFTTFNVLGNDTFAPDAGETLTITALGGTPTGTVQIATDGLSVRYKPLADAFGADVFTYTVSDGSGGTSTASVAVTVRDVNDAPTAVDDEVADIIPGSLDNVIDVLANDRFTPDVGETLTVALVTAPDQGGSASVTTDGKHVRYSPGPGFNGADERFTYTVSDGRGGTDTATVLLHVQASDFLALPDAYSVVEDTPFILVSGDRAHGVLANDVNRDGIEFVIGYNPTSANLGTITGNPDGTFRYVPPADFFGTDSFFYTLTGAGERVTTAKVTMTVLPRNDAPTWSAPRTYEVNEDSAFTTVNLAAFSPGPANEAAQHITVTVTTDQGALFSTPPILGADGKLTFQPAANRFGAATLRVTARDDAGTANGGSDALLTEYTLTILAVNDAPLLELRSTSITVDEDNGTSSFIDVARGQPGAGTTEAGQRITFEVTTGSSLFAEGPAISSDGELVFSTQQDAYGVAILEVVAHDDGGTLRGGVDTSAAQTILVTVRPVNDPPQTEPDFFFLDEDDGATLLDILANDDTLPDAGEAVGLVTFGPAPRGETRIEDGQAIYRPAADFNGVERVPYTITDGHQLTAAGIVTIKVRPVNDAPVAVGDAYDAHAGTLLDIDNKIGLLVNDLDVDGDELRIVVAEQPKHGRLELDTTGAFRYLSEADFHGEDSFSYRVRDNQTDSSPARVILRVSTSLAPTAAFSTPKPAVVMQQEVAFTDLSSDPNGDIVAWEWSFGDKITSAERHPKHTYLSPCDCRVLLTVTDRDGLQGSISQALLVTLPINGTPTEPPKANAGTDQQVVSGDLVLLNGTGGDGRVAIGFTWTQLSGPIVSLNSNGGFATFRAPAVTVGQEQVIRFALVIFDGHYRSAPDIVQVTIVGEATSGRLAVDAGLDRTIAAGSRVALEGTARGVSNQAAYTWRQADEKSPVRLKLFQLGTQVVFEAPYDAGPITLVFAVEDHGRIQQDSVTLTVPVSPVFTAEQGAGGRMLISADVPGVTFKWRFGDGTTGSGRDVIHNYGKAGDYKVSLAVTAADGTTHNFQQALSVSEPSTAARASLADKEDGFEMAPLGWLAAGLAVGGLLVVAAAVAINVRGRLRGSAKR